MSLRCILLALGTLCLANFALAAFSEAQKAVLNKFVGTWLMERPPNRNGITKIQAFQFNWVRINATDMRQLIEIGASAENFRSSLLSSIDGDTVEVLLVTIRNITVYKSGVPITIGSLQLFGGRSGMVASQYSAPLFSERVRLTYQDRSEWLSVTMRLLGETMELQFVGSGEDDLIYTLKARDGAKQKLEATYRKLDDEGDKRERKYGPVSTCKFVNKLEVMLEATDVLEPLGEVDTENRIWHLAKHVQFFRGQTENWKPHWPYIAVTFSRVNEPTVQIAPWKANTDALGNPIAKSQDQTEEAAGQQAPSGDNSEKRGGRRLTERRKGSSRKGGLSLRRKAKKTEEDEK